ncbi:EscU/YscU/HrcU family type III secretion system export apparatus switch protein [Ningiella sp. W23]|uniref:EscU/YscU/HrcU family type III secretion system export apparatus switch protein n=1 Tax=Ningiella sp. W23 TaxID=3023715 RepID=UPI00375803EE
MHRDKHRSKQNKAVALSYQQNSGEAASTSPKITAKGSGSVADEILKLAEHHGIFIHQDEHLSDALTQLDLGQEIPPALYTVIAELIAFSYILEGKFPKNWNNIHQKVDFNE